MEDRYKKATEMTGFCNQAKFLSLKNVGKVFIGWLPPLPHNNLLFLVHFCPKIATVLWGPQMRKLAQGLKKWVKTSDLKSEGVVQLWTFLR